MNNRVNPLVSFLFSSALIGFTGSSMVLLFGPKEKEKLIESTPTQQTRTNLLERNGDTNSGEGIKERDPISRSLHQSPEIFNGKNKPIGLRTRV